MTQDAPQGTSLVVAQPRVVAGGGRLAFMPWGLAPLIGFGVLLVIALGPFAFGEVQGATAASARKALTEGGFSWARAEVSGQWVVLTGSPPSREAAAAAIAAVNQEPAATLFGEAAPATWVIDRFTRADEPLLPAAPAVTPQTRRADEQAPPAAAPAPSDPVAAECDRSMAALLGTATIGFSTNSSVIGMGSSRLLDSIARAAEACTGVLRIAGHTDDAGSEALNSALSLRRAEAVRAALIQRGIPAERLVAEGFGASRPLSPNTSEDGRARNRRIEIHTAGVPPT